MSRGKTVVESLWSIILFVAGRIKSIDNLMVKSDEENLEKALENPKERLEFHKKVEEVLNQSTPKKMTLNGRDVTISV